MFKDKPSFRYNVNLQISEPADVAYMTNEATATGESYHYHEGLEIMQIWSEDGIVLVEDQVYPMRKGHIYLFNAQDLHATMPSAQVPYVRSKITFSPLFLRGVLEEMDQLDLLDPFTGSVKSFSHYLSPDEGFISRFDRLFSELVGECAGKQPGYAAAVRADLIKMLVMIRRWFHSERVKEAPSLSPAHGHIRNILDYVNNHLEAEISFSALCQATHLSKYRICHLFKESTGMTISQYAVTRRISNAKKLLLTDRSISDISLETGFSSFSLFSRTFKRITGCSPREYRRRYRPPLV